MFILFFFILSSFFLFFSIYHHELGSFYTPLLDRGQENQRILFKAKTNIISLFIYFDLSLNFVRLYTSFSFLSLKNTAKGNKKGIPCCSL